MKTISYFTIWLGCAALLTACANNPAMDESKALLADGRAEEGVAVLERAMKQAPDDRDPGAARIRANSVAVPARAPKPDTEHAWRLMEVKAW